MAVDMFIKIDGIDGESKDSAHKGEIDVLAWSWGVSNSGSMHIGGGGGAGKANIQDLSLTKWVDKGSCALMLHSCNGKHIPKAVLTVRKAGDKPVEYIIVTIEDILVTSVSTGGSGGEDRLTENVTLNFAKVKVEYKEQAKDGSGKPAGNMAWNVEENVAQ
jgi:type VI secretion system secreted protein Hcp